MGLKKIFFRLLRKIKTKISIEMSYLQIDSIINIGQNPVFSPGLYIKGGQYITIGDDFYAGPDCRFEAWDSYQNEHFKPQLIVGNRVKINSKCHIGAINKVQIGDDVLIGTNVLITDHAHGRNVSTESSIPPTDRRLFSKGPVIIGARCWICENVVILPNVNIGEGAIVGASAVVTHDVPPNTVVGGNPAKILKYLYKSDEAGYLS